MYHRNLTPFTARDGENLAFYQWQAEASGKQPGDIGPPPRGVVLLVHGLGEHAGRYNLLANTLCDWGFKVCAYDQRGHGESGGVPGRIPKSTTLLDDLAEIYQETRLQHPKRPLVLFGHSLGGLVASHFVALQLGRVDALVLSSPALEAGLSAFQKILLKVLPRLAPDLLVSNGLNAQFLSRDPKVVTDYLADPLVHNKISPRLAQFIATAGPETISAARQWRTPTLLMYAGADKLVKPSGSHRFANHAIKSKNVRPGTVTAKCFNSHFHELFNDLQPEPVYKLLQTWLKAQF